MTKKEFEKRVAELITLDGAKVVSFNTSKDTNGLFKGLYISRVIAIRNHVAHAYNAYQEPEESNKEITVTYATCLGA